MRIRCICGQKYNIKDELAGQYVRCRKCGEHVLVHSVDQPLPAAPVASRPAVEQPAQPAQAPAFDQGLPDNDPNYLGGLTDSQMSMGPAHGVSPTPASFPARPGVRRPKTKHARLDFSNVNLGLQLIFGGITLGLCCALFAIVFLYARMNAIGGIMLMGAFIGNLMSMIGYIFCIWVPAQTGARPLIISANVCNGVNVLVSLMKALVTASNPELDTPLLDFVSFLVGTATIILFLLFLKKVSEFVGDTNAAENAWSLLIFYLAVGGIAAFFVLSLVFVLPELPTKIRLVYVIVGVLSILIVLLIWLIHFLKFIADLEFRRSERRR